MRLAFVVSAVLLPPALTSFLNPPEVSHPLTWHICGPLQPSDSGTLLDSVEVRIRVVACPFLSFIVGQRPVTHPAAVCSRQLFRRLS